MIGVLVLLAIFWAGEIHEDAVHPPVRDESEPKRAMVEVEA